MPNRFTSPEVPNAHLGSQLYGESKHGSPEQKRASVAEVLTKLRDILSILPQDSKRRIGNQVENIRKNPEQAIEVIRNEIEAQKQIIELLDNEISTEEALKELDSLVPKGKIQ